VSATVRLTIQNPDSRINPFTLQFTRYGADAADEAEQLVRALRAGRFTAAFVTTSEQETVIP
jgi:preprotein translocase subunit SecD